ncbi:MAG TPA: glycoside hydrolase family 36 protein [Acidimicrobiales bacterium]|nr:glycoside hydrolase family 36 protein [Acidimicrobiales bacterium]
MEVLRARADARLEVTFEHVALGGGRRLDWRVWNPGTEPVRIEQIAIEFSAAPDMVLEHGWQSWSVVRRCAPDDARPERKEAAEWGRSTHAADPDGLGEVVTGDQFLLTDVGLVGFLEGSRHLSTVEVRGDVVSAVALLDGVELAPGATRSLDPIWFSDAAPGDAYSEYASLWGAASAARVGAVAPVGWCSWYQYFGEVTPGVIRSNLAAAAAAGLDLVQIDDGYQRSVGEWLEVSDDWAVPMADVAAEIAATGLAAGIWTAPFLVADGGPIATEHPDWLVTHRSGHPLRAMFNPAWGGWALALDTTHPEVLAHLTQTFAALRAMGFGYHKIDFCYAAAMPGHRHDATLTRAQALRAGLDAVRAGVGDDAFLLGCGCPFGPAVGVVDAMRVSADVAPTWLPAASWPGLEEAAPAARNAVQASVLRAPLHRRVFLDDPDCLLLRPDALTGEQRDVLAAAIAGSGGFTVVSDDLGAYGDAEWAALAEAGRLAALGDSVLDIVDPFAMPVVVRGDSLQLEVDWTIPSATIVER